METIQNVSTQDGETPTNPVPVSKDEYEALLVRVKDLEGGKRQAVGEAKDATAKWRELRDEVDGKEKGRLQEEGKTQELLLIAEKEKSEIAQERDALKKGRIKDALEVEVSRHARDAKDVRDVIRALDDYADLMSYDDATGRITGVKEAVQKVREVKDWFFQKDTPRMIDSRPSGTPQERSLEDMTLEEKIGLLNSGGLLEERLKNMKNKG